MHKNSLTTVFTVAAVLCCWRPARASERSNAVNAVMAIYREQIAGVEARDVARTFMAYDPGFVHVNAKGQTQSLQELEQRVAASYENIRQHKVLLFQVLDTKFDGVRLVLQYYQKDHLEIANKNEPDPNKTDPYFSEGRYEDTWQRRGSGWRLISERALATKFEEDWSKLSPEERRIRAEAKMATLKQQMEMFNYANHAHACTMGWGDHCTGW